MKSDEEPSTTAPTASTPRTGAESGAEQHQDAADTENALQHEATPSELSKWSDMIDNGIAEYMRAHPNRFQRRVRRGIPRKFRWQVWKAAVRLDEVEMPQEEYSVLSTRRNNWTPAIEIDIARTFPELKTFDADQQQRLLRVLNAYAGHNPKLGYCQGMNFVAGLLLLVSDSEEESFAVLLSLMDHPHFGLSGFYRERLPLLRRYLEVCDKLVQESVPELSDHFKKENVQPAVYLHQWFLTLFINCFPLSMVEIIWDVIICEGLPVILRIAVSILQVLKDSLLSMHFEEIIKFFKMMKTYDDEDGELNAFRIGQLLMKHTEQVQIPCRTLEYLKNDLSTDDGGTFDIDAPWDGQQLADGSWFGSFPSLQRMWPFGSTRRRGPGGSGSSNSPVGPARLPAPTAMDGSHSASGDKGPEAANNEPSSSGGAGVVTGWVFL